MLSTMPPSTRSAAPVGALACGEATAGGASSQHGLESLELGMAQIDLPGVARPGMRLAEGLRLRPVLEMPPALHDRMGRIEGVVLGLRAPQRSDARRVGNEWFSP